METDTLINALRQSGLENLTFSTPWSARLFGMTLAASERGLFTLTQFQASLIKRIEQREHKGCIKSDDDYYTCWLEALQELIETQEIWGTEQLKAREAEVVLAAEHRQDEQRRGNHVVQPETIQ